MPGLEELGEKLREILGSGVLSQALAGAVDGLFAGIGIALPYLLPFYLLLSVLEDVGYLPRLGFLLDGLMHRLGLHGKSVIPFVLGYGCSVPAVLATRILEDERDRLITAALAVMIPCAARTVVIFGLVGRFLGPWMALGLYLGNALVVAVAATILAHFFPATGPGLIMEIPPYRWPTVRITLGKTWLRLREFVKVAWPILIGSSFILALAEALGWQSYLNSAARIFTWPLGLPAQTGVPLIFGVLRKELALLLLAQAMGPRISAPCFPWSNVGVHGVHHLLCAVPGHDRRAPSGNGMAKNCSCDPRHHWPCSPLGPSHRVLSLLL
jgi:ferrous iron transport protein B